MRKLFTAISFVLAFCGQAVALSDANVPTKIAVPWGNSAAVPYIRTVPVASQIGVQNCAASFTDGFPPLTFQPSTAGGCPPFGADFNGVLNVLSAWTRWINAGGPILYDAAFSSTVGGYPQGAVLTQAANKNCFWISTVDSNSSNPDSAGANWTNACFAAPQITYTAPGTGGSAQTAQTKLNQVLYATDYGAKCDGVTNDATAFQNLLNEAVTLGVPARFAGTCVISTGLTISGGGVDFGGGNGPNSGALQEAGSATNGSILQVPSGINAITISSPSLSPSYLHDFVINYASTAASDTAIVVSAADHYNSGSIFERLSIVGSWNGFHFLKAASWVIRDTLVAIRGVDPGSHLDAAAVIIEDQFNADFGDNTITGSTLSTQSGIAGTATAAILWESSGGLRVVNNKIIGVFSSGIHLFPSTGVTTSDFIIQGNSIELYTIAGILISRQGTGTLSNFNINGNQFADAGTSSPPCISIPTDTGWLSNMVVNGNVCSLNLGSQTAFSSATPINGLVVSNNMFSAAGSGNTSIVVSTQTSTNCILGPNAKVGTFGSSTASSCTVVAPP